MKMKSIIPAVATAVMVPPQLSLNTQRKGPFDVLSGAFSANLNEFFERARINGTVIDSDYGECDPNGPCTGQLGLMKTGEADFSLFGSSSESFVKIQNLKIGPFTEAVEIFYQAIPYARAYKSNSDVLYSANQMKLETHLLQMVFFLCVYLLVNVSISRFGSLRLVSLSTLFGWFMRQLDARFKMPHRQVISMVFMVNSLFTLIFIACAFNSEMVVEHKARYYESLEEIIKYHKMRETSVLVVKGLIVDRKLSPQGNIWARLAREATLFPLSSLTELPFQVAGGSVLVSNTHILYYVRSFLCSHANHRDEYQLLRESKPLAAEAGFMLFSANASAQIVTRVSRLISLEFEAGIVRHDLHREIKSNVAEIFAGNKLQIHRCEGRQNEIKWPSDAFTDISLEHCVRLIAFFLSLISIAFMVFLCELVVESCYPKRKRNRRQRISLHL